MAKRAIPVGPAREEGKRKPSLGLNNMTVRTRQGIQIKPVHSMAKESGVGMGKSMKKALGKEVERLDSHRKASNSIIYKRHHQSHC